jgi:Tachylectin
MPWVGRKKVAFVPVYRTIVNPPDGPDVIPPDWDNLIRRRVLWYPDPKLGGADGSLRAWLHAASSGRADIDPHILPMKTVHRHDVLPDHFKSEMEESLRADGFDHAALVMLGGVGAGANRQFWSRFVMAEHTGVWAMEMIHGIAGFLDLYWQDYMTDPGDRAIGRFDEMSEAGLSHPTAYTKVALGWLDEAAVVRHSEAQTDYELQWIGLPGPPLSGRVAAVRIGEDVPYLMVEARKVTDQFEKGVHFRFGDKFSGIGGEGVIVYRVQTRRPDGGGEGTKLPVYLLTQKPLAPGESAEVDSGVIVTNTGETVGGNNLTVIDRTVSGVLLRYVDASQTGDGYVQDPKIIGRAGWQQFRMLFSGDNQVIYAVNADGQLLRYVDVSQTTGDDVSDPQVVGQSGWLEFKFLFSGNNNVIYAVNEAGQLLRYVDVSQTTGDDVSDPQVIGQSGWSQFTFLFSGDNEVIYAGNADGQLLRYVDVSQVTGDDVSDPQVVGQSGWLAFRFLFSGDNQVIYAVNQDGQLLRYVDVSQTTGDDVSDPQEIGTGGWLQFKFVFSGDSQVIYAVVP